METDELKCYSNEQFESECGAGFLRFSLEPRASTS